MTAPTGGRLVVGHLRVPFEGPGSGTGELTWGQRAAWRTFQADGEAKTLSGVVPVPPGTTVEEVAGSLRFVMSRHQSLRTRLVSQPGGDVRQELAATGEQRLEVVEAPAGTDPAAVADQVRRRFVTDPFDLQRDWPVRMAAVAQDGVVTHTVGVYLQTALDAHGLVALTRDLLANFGAERPEPVTAIQPLELAAKEAGRTARRQGEASLRHTEQVLLAVPMRRWPEPVEEGPPEWDTLRFRSPSLARAIAAVAARRGIDTSPVLLGAYAVGLAAVTGVSPVAMLLAVSNRFRPRAAESVSPLAQVGACLIDVADATLDEVVGRSWQAAMVAYKHAYYPPAERFELAQRLGATAGGPRDVSCYFNDRRARGVPRVTHDDGPVDVRDRTELRWDRQPGFPREKAYLNVDEVPGAIELALTVETGVLPRASTERLLRTMEDAAIGMALRPDTRTAPGSAPAGER